jgi:hypothetical protein
VFAEGDRPIADLIDLVADTDTDTALLARHRFLGYRACPSKRRLRACSTQRLGALSPCFHGQIYRGADALISDAALNVEQALSVAVTLARGIVPALPRFDQLPLAHSPDTGLYDPPAVRLHSGFFSTCCPGGACTAAHAARASIKVNAAMIFMTESFQKKDLGRRTKHTTGSFVPTVVAVVFPWHN